VLLICASAGEVGDDGAESMKEAAFHLWQPRMKQRKGAEREIIRRKVW